MRRWVVVAAVVLVPLLGYPLAVFATGPPRFPSREECVRVATADDPNLEVVYGRFDDPRAAETLLGELTRIGFVGAEIALDGCGRWKVSYDAIESLAQGQALAEEVRMAGFDARVEHEG